MTIELYNDGYHKCYAYEDLVTGEGIQSNQFLIVDNGHAALIDPGGELTYSRLYMHINDQIFVKELDYVIASHQDPDIVASLSKWMLGTDCKLVVPKLWARFVPHFCRSGKTDGRVISIPDEGISIPLGNSVLKAVPAHFLHSEGNFQFYDPVSKILFSGDLGASTVERDLDRPVLDFDAHIPHMTPFHQRYMVSNKVCRYWANMVRNLDIEWIVPQHGPSFKGPKMVARFIEWVEGLQCGVDLVTQSTYRIPA